MTLSFLSAIYLVTEPTLNMTTEIVQLEMIFFRNSLLPYENVTEQRNSEQTIKVIKFPNGRCKKETKSTFAILLG